jgi:two-component system, OmpR family, sensor kinase
LSSAASPGIALRCDAGGAVLQVLRDTLPLARAQIAEPFERWVAPSSQEKAREFLRDVQSRQAAFNWELTVCKADGSLVPLHFGGAVSEDGLLIVGARTRGEMTRFYQELLQINNEQTNTLRATLKELSLQSRERAELDDRHYEELTQLNNELSNIQRELAKKNVELARLNEQKNLFLGVVSHDLRNPLDVILSYSQFLREDAAGLLPPEQMEFVEIISAKSFFMLNLIDNLLDLAQIEAGKLRLDPVSTDIPALLARNLQAQRLLAARKRIELLAEVQPDLPRVVLDPARLEQVLNNLVGNAIKFSPVDSAVRVVCAREQEWLVLEVHDQGPGIGEDERERLFGFFQKGGASTTGGEKKTGLGLAIVHSIVQRQGGEITVRSQPAGGTCFRVTLPTGQ